jgi:hypothetical protein
MAMSALLWFGVLGGLVAWTLHLVLGFALITGACGDGGDGTGGTGVALVFLALTVALAAVAGLATLAALRVWRTETGWRRFMGFFGALLDGLGLATIALGGTQLLFLRPCA